MANDLNQVVLIGRLTRNAETKYTNSGTPVSKFGLAVNRKRKQGDNYVDEASFFDVAMWGRLAETLSQYLTKGKQICVAGELRQYRWEQDGQKRSRVEVVANNIQLLGSERQGGTSDAHVRHQNSQRNGAPQQQSQSQLQQGEFLDDIPF